MKHTLKEIFATNFKIWSFTFIQKIFNATVTVYIKPITRWIAKYNEHTKKSSEIVVLIVGGFAAIANFHGMKLF